MALQRACLPAPSPPGRALEASVNVAVRETLAERQGGAGEGRRACTLLC